MTFNGSAQRTFTEVGSTTDEIIDFHDLMGRVNLNMLKDSGFEFYGPEELSQPLNFVATEDKTKVAPTQNRKLVKKRKKE